MLGGGTLYQRIRAYNVAFYKQRDRAMYEQTLARLIEETKKGRIAFITGRIALIFQNRFAFTTFFRNFGRICNLSLYKGSSED